MPKSCSITRTVQNLLIFSQQMCFFDQFDAKKKGKFLLLVLIRHHVKLQYELEKSNTKSTIVALQSE